MRKHHLRRHGLLAVVARHRGQVVTIAVPIPCLSQRVLQAVIEIVGRLRLIIRVGEIHAARARKTDCDHHDHRGQRRAQPPAHLPKRIRRAENPRIIENVVAVDHRADHRCVDDGGEHPNQNQHSTVAQRFLAPPERQPPAVAAEPVPAVQRRRDNEGIHRIGPRNAAVPLRRIIAGGGGQEIPELLRHAQIRVRRTKRNIVDALGFFKARHGHPAERHRFQPEGVDHHGRVIRPGNRRENGNAHRQIQRLHLFARRQENGHGQQDAGHGNRREAVGIRREAKDDHRQIERPAPARADQQQLRRQQHHVRQHIRLQRPAAHNHVPRVQRQQEQRRQCKAPAADAPRHVPHQRQRQQPHQQHRKTQRELAQPEELDERNEQIRIQRGHLRIAPRFKIRRPARAVLIRSVVGQAECLHRRHRAILILPHRQFQKAIAADERADRQKQAERHPIPLI